jgi:MYXO-CTERM domain-containing protein
VCSTAAQTTDCSSLDNQCQAGLCDPNKAGTGTQKCAGENVANGTLCALADKCQLEAACNGGTCVGTPKDCSTTTPCRVASCNSSTGACEEDVAPVGTSCNTPTGCTQNAACDATGNCVGTTVPDGTPCDAAGCTTSAACVTGTCTCLDRPDFGGDPLPADPADGPDASVTETPSGHGCAMGGATRAPSALFVVFALILVVARRRRA